MILSSVLPTKLPHHVQNKQAMKDRASVYMGVCTWEKREEMAASIKWWWIKKENGDCGYWQTVPILKALRGNLCSQGEEHEEVGGAVLSLKYSCFCWLHIRVYQIQLLNSIISQKIHLKIKKHTSLR